MSVQGKTSLNRKFQAAKAAKQDEFYTQLSDIEKELKHYAPHFKGKKVYCNCDDPRISQGGPRFYLANGDGSHRRLYDRIVIRQRKKVTNVNR